MGMAAGLLASKKGRSVLSAVSPAYAVGKALLKKDKKPASMLGVQPQASMLGPQVR